MKLNRRNITILNLNVMNTLCITSGSGDVYISDSRG